MKLSAFTKKTRRFLYTTAVLAVAATYCAATSPLYAITQRDLNSVITHKAWYDPKDQLCAQADGGPANLTVGKDFSLGPAGEQNGKQRRVNLIKALMASFNITPEQGAGIVGNFMAESGGSWLPPDVNEGGEVGPPAFVGGYGWAQWTGPRQHTFIDFVVNNGYMSSASDRANDAANYAYLLHELTTSQKATITELKVWTSPEDSAVSFEHTFERAGKPVLDKRKANAKQAFNEYLEVGGGTGIDAGGGASVDEGVCGGTGEAGIVGQYAFPLLGSKKVVLNPGMFKNNTADRGGHPYIAFDILANPGTPVAAFLSGTVTAVTTDKCPGRMISIYNKESNLTVSYLHMEFGPKDSDLLNKPVTVGTQIGSGISPATVGAAPNGCGTPHLHIDAAVGMNRPGCKREDCPAANQAKFRDIGPQLFQTFQALKDN